MKESKKEEFARCKRCNRLLKTEENKKRGYGNHCWKIHLKLIKENSKKLF